MMQGSVVMGNAVNCVLCCVVMGNAMNCVLCCVVMGNAMNCMLCCSDGQCSELCVVLCSDGQCSELCVVLCVQSVVRCQRVLSTTTWTGSAGWTCMGLSFILSRSVINAGLL